MPELTPITLSHFCFFSFKDEFYSLSAAERREFHAEFLKALRQSVERVDIYQVYPTRTGQDFLVWSSVSVDSPAAAHTFFASFAAATNPFRRLVAPAEILWGFTRPSQYTKTRSTQEIDPFAVQRKPYLMIYPFVKTTEWYLMSREARQGMMNEHIRIGKEFPQITQLLLYSFGLQDQEFIVVYETDDPVQFSDLVSALRSSEGRRYTLRDTPLFTALYHPADETLALWEN